MTAEQMKTEMIEEISGMIDNVRLADEYNHFFGKSETIDGDETDA